MSNFSSALLLSLFSIYEITSSRIISYVRATNNSKGNNIITLYKLVNNKVEALEFYVKEDSKVTNVSLAELKLKPNLLICAIIRDGKRITPSGQDRILKGDSVVVVTTNIGLNDIQEIMRS